MRKRLTKQKLYKDAVCAAILVVAILAAFLIIRQINRYISGERMQSKAERMFYRQKVSADAPEIESAAESDFIAEESVYAAVSSQENTENMPADDTPDSNGPTETKVLPFVYTEDIPEYDFTELLEINSDIKGWLYIPAAEIDNPIVQAADNDYYLHRNIYGEEEYEGTFFFDHRCQWGMSLNCVIYGHSMLDGSMMYKLRNFLNQEVADKNPSFLYITPEHVYECQIFSVYRTTIYDDYIWFEFFGDEDYLSYVQMMKDKSEVEFPDCHFTAADRMMTISTCNRSLIDDGTGRLAVYAKIVKIT